MNLTKSNGIEIIKFKGISYPALQAKGNAAKFCRPFALEILKGTGLDIGCSQLSWAHPGARPIDLSFGDGYHAMNLPEGEFDYIISSHMVEHFCGNVFGEMLPYWNSKLKESGVLFLYLPNYENNLYWRAWNNKKHIHHFTPQIFRDYFSEESDKWKNYFVTDGYDLNSSFYAIAEKAVS